MHDFVRTLGSLTFTLASLSLCACGGGGAVGDGHVETETRPAGSFTRVDNRTELQVEVSHDASSSVQVTVDSNLQPLIECTVTGGTLSLEQTESIASLTKGVIVVTLPHLDAASVGGSGPMVVRGFGDPTPLALDLAGSGSLDFDGACGDLSVTLGGSGLMTVTGSGGHLSAIGSGSGSIDASGFAAGAGADIDVMGSGDATANATGDATLSVEGSGSIRATLNGGTADFSISGSGDIDWTGTERTGRVSETGSGSVTHQ